MRKPYEFRNCQSLFGYASKVHQRCGYRCQLCGCGGPPLDFALWRQFTVEHLIGESQGGYVAQLRPTVAQRFPTLSQYDQEQLILAIDEANTITACSFCNSTTSRDRHEQSMYQLLAQEGDPDDVLLRIKGTLSSIIARKRSDVEWKLTSVREAFNRLISTPA
jgi:hypothetical protein